MPTVHRSASDSVQNPPGGQASGHRAGVTASGRRLVIRACDHTSAREVPPDSDKLNWAN